MPASVRVRPAWPSRSAEYIMLFTAGVSGIWWSSVQLPDDPPVVVYLHLPRYASVNVHFLKCSLTPNPPSPDTHFPMQKHFVSFELREEKKTNTICFALTQNHSRSVCDFEICAVKSIPL